MPSPSKTTKKTAHASPSKGGDNKKHTQDISPEAAEQAFEAMVPRLLELDGQNLASMSADIEKAAVFAAAIGRWVKGKESRARFASLPAEHFDHASVDDLEKVALSAWHAAVMARSASAGKSEAKLPVDLVREALGLKQRMLDLVTYHFGTDPVDGPEVEDIRIGIGYSDLAADLVRLRKLYEKHHDRVKLDPKNYRKTDVGDAGRIAHQIFQELGESRNQDQKAWSDLSTRAFTLLIKVYAEVSAAGQWLWRREDGLAKFPSLYWAGRSAPSKSADKPSEAGAPGDSAESGRGEG